MKQVKTFYVVAALILLFSASSCEKVINLDLKDASAQLVIEGNISNSAGPYTVKLSSSVNYDQSNVFPPVQHALVVVSDNKGAIDTLKETSPGNYQTSSLQGMVGNVYTLFVRTSDAKEYRSSSTMPVLVPMDSIFVQKASLSFGDKDTLDVVAAFKDPSDLGNNYRFLLAINQQASTRLNIINDKYYNGNAVKYTIFREDKEYIKKGDSLTVEMRNLDKPNYDYFNTLNDVINSDRSAAPANPVSNITGGALGYFCAYSSTKLSLVVK